MTNQDLLEKAKQRTGMSQGAIAKALGIRQPSLSQWNGGNAELSDETYIKLAELAGLDPAEVILEKHMRKAGPAAAAVWAKAKRGLEALKGGIAKMRIMPIMLNISWTLTALTTLLILVLVHQEQRQNHANPTA
ncbi:helix-turn-helix domain-containing protein [Acidithiobacillus sulfuriphilus]|uniref:helix-turn-helix domain-containing protein n=1 Tax=Acidithiobacillus sulfuriphilus TaxID=1867749 RepID=UPI003F62B80C